MPVKQKEAQGGLATEVNLIAFVCDVKPDANNVYVVGDFNNWDPAEGRMVRTKGAFHKLLHLAPGEYQYKFLVDGEWHTDPSAETQVPNDFGTLNSIIRVGGKL